MKMYSLLFLILSVIFALLSCATEKPNAANTERATLPAPAIAPLPVDNNLNSAAFKNLPPEARVYLEQLAGAFGSRDEAFLLAQGEPQFEAEMRPRYNREGYLALLYRFDTYAKDSPYLEAALPCLDPAKIRGISYLSWKANGPLLEIKAQLTGTDSKVLPCVIMLVWRLREPKIQGLFL